MAKRYEIWTVEADATYLPIAGQVYPTKAYASKIARLLSKSEAFRNCMEVGVVLNDTTVATFKVKVRA